MSYWRFWWECDGSLGGLVAPNSFYVFFVRSGWKLVKFEKGKATIAVPSLDKLPFVIDTVITGVRNGELYQQLAEASN
jgi:hypothetical protein